MSLIKHITFSLGRVGVKGSSDNVTEYDVFFLEVVPLVISGIVKPESNSKLVLFRNSSNIW